MSVTAIELSDVHQRTDLSAATGDIDAMRTLGLRRRRQHLTFWLTLGAWLFALSSGVVNACLVTAADRSGGATHAQAAADLHEAGSGPVSLPGPERGRAAGMDSCLKFCADEFSALSKSKSVFADLDMPVPAVLVPWSTFGLDVPPGSQLSLRRPAAQGTPLVIRFVRLTL